MAEFNTLFSRQGYALDLLTRGQHDSTRPSIATSLSGSIRQVATDAIKDYLEALEDANEDVYRTTPYYMETGDVLQGRPGKRAVLVAGPALCDGSGSTSNSGTPSPTALVRDRYYDCVVTADGSLTLNGGTPTGTLAIEPLDRALPANFMLNIGGGHCQLEAAAAQGATSLSLRRRTDCTISGGNASTPAANRYFCQYGVSNWKLKDVLLWGDPTTHLSETLSENASVEWLCDGFVFGGSGCQGHYVHTFNFDGWGGVILQVGDTTTRAGRQLPDEKEEGTLHAHTAYQCLGGRLWQAADSGASGKCIAASCRDYGDYFKLGSSTKFDEIHNYGCGLGAYVAGMVRGDTFELETCTNGFDFVTGSEGSAIDKLRMYGNTGRGGRVYTAYCNFGHMYMNHGITDEPLLTIGRYADYSKFHVVGLSASEADGITIGDGSDRAVIHPQLTGGLIGSGGTYGVRQVTQMSAPVVHLHIGGYDTDYYMDNAADINGGEVHLYGASSATVRWSDGTNQGTGTLGAPNLAAAAPGLVGSSKIACHPY